MLAQQVSPWACLFSSKTRFCGFMCPICYKCSRAPWRSLSLKRLCGAAVVEKRAMHAPHWAFQGGAEAGAPADEAVPVDIEEMSLKLAMEVGLPLFQYQLRC